MYEKESMDESLGMFHKEDAASQMPLLGFGVEEMSHRMLNLLTLASIPKRAMFRILQVEQYHCCYTNLGSSLHFCTIVNGKTITNVREKLWKER